MYVGMERILACPRSLADLHSLKDDFPLHPTRPYTPKAAPLSDLMGFETKIGVAHVCIVSITSYATDNSHLVDALKKLQGRGRGVAVVDIDTVTDAELDEMHAVGVRGIRFNLHSFKKELEQDVFRESIHKYANKIRRLNWVIQLFVQMHQLVLVADEIPKLGVDVVLDHIGAPTDPTIAAQEQPGYAELMKLLRAKQVYVKLSGVYRFSGENMPRLDEYCTEILREAPTQVVWGSDRPHPAGSERLKNEQDRWIPQDYLVIDIPAFIAKCREWCGHDEQKIKMIFVDNPRRLWRYDHDD